MIYPIVYWRWCASLFEGVAPRMVVIRRGASTNGQRQGKEVREQGRRCSWDSSSHGTVRIYWIACHILAELKNRLEPLGISKEYAQGEDQDRAVLGGRIYFVV